MNPKLGFYLASRAITAGVNTERRLLTLSVVGVGCESHSQFSGIAFDPWGEEVDYLASSVSDVKLKPKWIVLTKTNRDGFHS
mgnify:CR=1 FL=1